MLDHVAEEYLTWLSVEQGRSRNTLRAYRRDLAAYESFLRSVSLDPETSDAGCVERYLALRASEGSSSASRARALAAIRGLHRFALDEGYASSDASGDVRAPKVPRRLPKALEEEEVSRLIDGISGDDPLSRRDRALLEMLYGTGMRVGESVGMSLTDLLDDPPMARVLGKGDKERLVPVGRQAVVAMTRWLSPSGRGSLEPRKWARRGDSEALFLNARGGRLTRQGAWLVVKRRAEAAGIAPGVIHPHVLRHSCATHMLAHGADIRVVQELLGHVSIATTQIYTKVSPEHLRRAYEAAHPRADASKDK